MRPRQLKCCGIVGAGLMGGGIAMSCAEAGMKARMAGAKFALRRKRHRVCLQKHTQNTRTLKLTAFPPLKIGRAPKGKDHLPTIHFSGAKAVSFGEGRFLDGSQSDFSLNFLVGDLDKDVCLRKQFATFFLPENLDK